MLTNNLQQVSEELREFYLAQERIIMDKFISALSPFSDEVLMAEYSKAYSIVESAKEAFSTVRGLDRDFASFIRAACYKILRERGFEKETFSNRWRKRKELIIISDN